MNLRVCQELARKPGFALLVLYVFIVGSFLSPSLSISNLIIILAGLVSFVYFLFNRQEFVSLAGREKFLLAFLFFTVMSCGWGDKGSFVYALKSSLTVLFFVFFIGNFKEEIYKSFNNVLMVVAFSSFILAIILLYKHFSQHGVEFRVVLDEFYGPIIQSIRIASVFAIALLIIVWNFFSNNGWRKWVSILMLFPVLLVMLLLRSRGAILSLGVGLSALYVIHNLKLNVFARQCLIGIALLGGVVFAGALYSLEFNPKGIMDTERIPIWLQSVAEVYPEKFWQGIGYSKHQSVTVSGVLYTHSHNIFISLFRVTGLIGLLLFMGYLFSVVKRNIGERKVFSGKSLLWAWIIAAFCILFFNGKHPVYIGPDIFMILWLPLALL